MSATCSKCGTPSKLLAVYPGSLTSVGKKSWWGCGNHIPSVLDSVAEAERCTCEPKVEKEGKTYPPKAEKAD